MPRDSRAHAGSLHECAVLDLSSLLAERSKVGWKLCAYLVAWVIVITTSVAWGQDKKAPEADIPTRFLEKLRERGWNDVAIDYLEQAEDDPLTTQEFLADRDYHLAVTRAAMARQAVGENERQNLLQQAAEGFQKFAKEHSGSPQYISALSQVGNMLTEQSLATLNKADRLPKEATAEQESLRASARENIEQAAAAVNQLLTSIGDQLSQLPRGAELQAEKGAAALKQDLLAKQAEGRFLAANLKFEISRAYPIDAPERELALDTAAASFAKLRKDYENKLVGFYAVLYEGRCYQAAGDLNKAFKTFGELVNQPVGQADFRKLVARAYRYRAECYLAEGEYNKAIEESSEWLNQASSDELKQPEWLAVEYQLATAYTAKASKDPGGEDASRLRTDARKLFREVTRHPSEFQDDARTALALSGNDDSTQVEVTGFADAYSAGKAALERMSSAQLAVNLAKNNNPEGVAEIEDQVAASRQQATDYLQQALPFIDAKTSQDDAAAARYYLCWLYWDTGKSQQAAELGQLITDEHAETQYAPTAARVALGAYERLYLEAKQANAPDADVYADKLRSIAELIIERWNDTEAATNATELLISLAIQKNEFNEADRLLNELPEESRGAAGLSLGGSLWSQYLQKAAKSPNQTTAEIDGLKSRAGKLLSAGYQAFAKSSDLTTAQAAAVLYYVQFLLASGDSAKAIEVLENPSIGPLAVIKRGGKDEKGRAFALEASKAALRSYVSVDPPRTDDAIAMMEQLEKITGDSPEASKQLTGIYVTLGLQLQDQIKQLTAAGQKAKAAGVAAAFSSLLERVAQRGDSKSWAVQNWLAQTSLQLGSGLSGKDADRYLSQAEDAYRKILAEIGKDPSFAPNELAALAVRKKLGETLQARGKFALAVEEYATILQEKPNMLELQQDTAAALQAWGNVAKDPKTLEKSIHGMTPQANGKNLIWGWLQIAVVSDAAKRQALHPRGDTPPNQESADKFKELYFAARYHVVETRFQAAKLSDGESRTKQLEAVRQNINALKQLYPDLGGPDWQAKFEALLKEVNVLLKEAGK